MIPTIIFVVSGFCLIILVSVKMKSLKNKKQSFLLNVVSLGEHRVRNIYAQTTHHYSEVKEKGSIIISKQLPMHSKNLLNKAETLIREKAERYVGNIRNSRLLNNKKDGISEFFKNLSEKEKFEIEVSEVESEDKKL